ncbi:MULTISPECIES: NAD-dependent epimerase/dehydratase family protein [Thalassospira]|uniref:NAD-dependent epimerase/dehydratase domain-containing protein n=1 Tax=Thalassospira profundimaris TaxID=502049 RepID=A0A367VMD7_9PROT|nr:MULTISPECIES: NAD-dependent epimerase/dehydratase family protein [Thalassospira]KZB70926.1 hypothetical protein AUQ43_08745 [Thalassospira sp. MCCC 1A01148]MBR9899355.1 NAD-dependent epimerase/dehydratase family protein [Rhodospirillales bacterium]RCK25430.1 hypothetical protein TH6_02110 [Thalassospira profundimaris]
MKKVVVTGGAGLIGSYLTELLIDDEDEVVVIDDFSKGKKENLDNVRSGIKLVQADLEEPDVADDVFTGVDTVYHLASRAYGVGYSSRHHLDMLEHNERLTNNVLRAARVRGVKRMLITSSSCVHRDDGPDTVGELALFDGEPEVVNWGYGWAKRFLEQKAAIYARETGMQMTVVRPFNIYGERYRWMGTDSQAIPMLVKKVLDNTGKVEIWGSGKQRRNYMHALDCARIMKQLVTGNVCDGPVNIGFSETVSVTELVEMICRAANVTPELEYDETKPEGRFIKSSDPCRLLSLLPGFEQKIPLEEGVGRMIGWYKDTFPMSKEDQSSDVAGKS